MNRAVFDTNVLVSGFLSASGPPGRIVEWLRSGIVQAVLDDRIAAEYLEVLTRPVFHLPAAEVQITLTLMRSQSFWIESTGAYATRGMPDPDDAPFLECARAAEVPLVTGNTKHFPKSITGAIQILTPVQFVTLFGK